MQDYVVTTVVALYDVKTYLLSKTLASRSDTNCICKAHPSSTRTAALGTRNSSCGNCSTASSAKSMQHSLYASSSRIVFALRLFEQFLLFFDGKRPQARITLSSLHSALESLLLAMHSVNVVHFAKVFLRNRSPVSFRS